MSEDETTEPAGATRAPRRSGKPVAIGLLVLILGGAVFALSMWSWGREPKGPIEAIAAIDDDRVAVLRKGFEERGYTHIGVWTADGEMRWSEALFGVQDEPELTATGELVLVLVTEARGNPALHAFDRETGEFRWKVQQGPGEEPSTWGRALEVGQSVAWLMGPGRRIRVVDLSDGEVRATLSPEEPETVAYTWVDGDRLQLVGVGSTSMAVDASGELTRVDFPATDAAAPVTRDGDQLCLGHPPERCRRIPELKGHAIGDGVVWIHSETELGVLGATDLGVRAGSLEVGELETR
jgi:hypothetical protein